MKLGRSGQAILGALALSLLVSPALTSADEGDEAVQQAPAIVERAPQELYPNFDRVVGMTDRSGYFAMSRAYGGAFPAPVVDDFVGE